MCIRDRIAALGQDRQRGLAPLLPVGGGQGAERPPADVEDVVEVFGCYVANFHNQQTYAASVRTGELFVVMASLSR